MLNLQPNMGLWISVQLNLGINIVHKAFESPVSNADLQHNALPVASTMKMPGDQRHAALKESVLPLLSFEGGQSGRTAL